MLVAKPLCPQALHRAPPPILRSDCKFGAFDAAACRCKCMGESVVGGYTRDEATGQCTAMVTR